MWGGCGGTGRCSGLSWLEEQELAGKGGGTAACGDWAVWLCAAVPRECLWVLVHPELSSVCAWGLQKELCLSHGAVLHLPGHLGTFPKASLVLSEGPVTLWERGSKQDWAVPLAHGHASQ